MKNPRKSKKLLENLVEKPKNLQKNGYFHEILPKCS
jgi:hypothetical protein